MVLTVSIIAFVKGVSPLRELRDVLSLFRDHRRSGLVRVFKGFPSLVEGRFLSGGKLFSALLLFLG